LGLERGTAATNKKLEAAVLAGSSFFEELEAMDYIRRADILKCRALAATLFFHDSYGYTEGKVVGNKKSQHYT
jgi:hypothetical protein